MNPVFCPSCHKQISSESSSCEHCSAPVTATGRRLAFEAEQEEARKHLLANEAIKKAQQLDAQQRFQEQRANQAEVERQSVFNRATGKGVCPVCKSPNVKEYKFREGQNTMGANMACCLGCFLTPLAWLALPFMAGKKATAFECQYCSNRWRL